MPALPLNPQTGTQPSGLQIPSSSSSRQQPPVSVGGKDIEVLRNIQDAVWSDDEEDPECPLCMEEMDPSDVNFKPCVCGYQICRFCHHQIIHDLNGLCPACRRSYEGQVVEFVPVDPEEMKRLLHSKLLKSKINRQLEVLNRRHLRDVRIVIKSMVYVVGMRMPVGVGSDEFLQTLRSNDYFGQYGKISKLFLQKSPPTTTPSTSTSSASTSQDVGIYITYLRREDAARAIGALDGYPSPSSNGGGPKQLLKASFGTAKYCLWFLRGMKCEEGGGLGGGSCLGVHEWAGESDVFSRKDLVALQHTIKTTETGMDLQHQSQQRAAAASSSKPVSTVKTSRPPDEGTDVPALPRSASWATASRPSPASTINPTPSSSATNPLYNQPIRRPPVDVTPAKAKVLSLTTPGLPKLSSHPTPSKKASTKPRPDSSLDLDLTRTRSNGSGTTSEKVEKKRTMTVLSRNNTGTTSTDNTPPGLTNVPSGSNSRRPSLSGTSVVSFGSIPVSVETGKGKEESVERDSPEPIEVDPPSEATPTGLTPAAVQVELSPAQSSTVSLVSPESPHTREQPVFQPSVNAQALMDEVLTRRQGPLPIYTIQSPYPDFENVLDCFADGDFTYQLDGKMEIEVMGDDFGNGILELMGYRLDEMGKVEDRYQGEFDPFDGDLGMDRGGGTPEEEDNRKSSRFGFAHRGAGEILPGSSFASFGSPSSAVKDNSMLSKANPLRPFDVQDTSSRMQATRNATEQAFSGGSDLDRQAAQQSQYPGGSRAEASTSVHTPLNKAAVPYTMTSPQAESTRERVSSGGMPQMQQPPPPPGLSASATFPNYQNGQQSRSAMLGRHGMGGPDQQMLEQQMQIGMNGFQQQFQGDGRRAQSPGPGLRTGSGMGGRYRDAYMPAEQQPYQFQDPAIMSMRMGPPHQTYNNRQSYGQDQNPYEGNMSPYPQQAFPQLGQHPDNIPNNQRLLQHLAQQQQHHSGRTPSPAGGYGSSADMPEDGEAQLSWLSALNAMSPIFEPSNIHQSPPPPQLSEFPPLRPVEIQSPPVKAATPVAKPVKEPKRHKAKAEKGSPAVHQPRESATVDAVQAAVTEENVEQPKLSKDVFDSSALLTTLVNKEPAEDIPIAPPVEILIPALASSAPSSDDRQPDLVEQSTPKAVQIPIAISVTMEEVPTAIPGQLTATTAIQTPPSSKPKAKTLRLADMQPVKPAFVPALLDFPTLSRVSSISSDAPPVNPAITQVMMNSRVPLADSLLSIRSTTTTSSAGDSPAKVPKDKGKAKEPLEAPAAPVVEHAGFTPRKAEKAYKPKPVKAKKASAPPVVKEVPPPPPPVAAAESPAKQPLQPTRDDGQARDSVPAYRDLPDHYADLAFFRPLVKPSPAILGLPDTSISSTCSALSFDASIFKTAKPHKEVDQAMESFQAILNVTTALIGDHLDLLPKEISAPDSFFGKKVQEMIDLGQGDDEPESAVTRKDMSALNDALARRAGKMKVQMQKLEQLHTNITILASQQALHQPLDVNAGFAQYKSVSQSFASLRELEAAVEVAREEEEALGRELEGVMERNWREAF